MFDVIFQVQDLEREITKLRTALETQQDASLERLNAREQEWRGKLQEQRDKVILYTSLTCHRCKENGLIV